MAEVKLYELPSKTLLDPSVTVAELVVEEHVLGWPVGACTVHMDENPDMTLEHLRPRTAMLVWESSTAGVFELMIYQAAPDHVHRSVDLTLIGLTGISQDYPWEAGVKKYEYAECMDVLRDIYTYIQGEPAARFGIQVDSLVTGITVGEEEHDVSFETAQGVTEFTAGPWKLEPWADDDLSKRVDDLIETGTVEWREQSSRRADGTFRTRLRLWRRHSPTVRRNHLVFQLDENLFSPEITVSLGQPHRVRVVGGGSGDRRPVGHADNPVAVGSRWVYTEDDSNLTSRRACEERAKKILARMTTSPDTLTAATVYDREPAPFGLWGVGDTIHVKGHTALSTVNHWARITSITHRPDEEQRDIALERIPGEGA